jgi:hypothetical protein
VLGVGSSDLAVRRDLYFEGQRAPQKYQFRLTTKLDHKTPQERLCSSSTRMLADGERLLIFKLVINTYLPLRLPWPVSFGLS